MSPSLVGPDRAEQRRESSSSVQAQLEGGHCVARPDLGGAQREIEDCSLCAIMDTELIQLLKSDDKDAAAKGATMLASFLSKASFPSKSVQALREVLPAAPLQRIFSALSHRLMNEVRAPRRSTSPCRYQLVCGNFLC